MTSDAVFGVCHSGTGLAMSSKDSAEDCGFRMTLDYPVADLGDAVLTESIHPGMVAHIH